MSNDIFKKDTVFLQKIVQKGYHTVYNILFEILKCTLIKSDKRLLLYFHKQHVECRMYLYLGTFSSQCVLI